MTETLAVDDGLWERVEALTPEAVPAWRFFWPLLRLMQRRASAEAASKSSVFLASSEDAANVSGAYLESNAKPGRPSKLALDFENQELACDLAQTLIARAPPAPANG